MGKVKNQGNQNAQAKEATSPRLRKKKKRLYNVKNQMFDKTFDENEEGTSGLFQLFTDPELYFSKKNESQKKIRSREVKQKKALEIVEKIVSKDFVLNDDNSESSIEFLRDASDHQKAQEHMTRLPLIDIRRFHQSHKPRCDSPCPPLNFPLTDLKSRSGKVIEEEEKDVNDSFISVVEDPEESLTFIASSPRKVSLKGKDYSKRKNGRNLKTKQFANSTSTQNHSIYNRFDFSQDLSPIASVHEESLIEDRQAHEETTPNRQQKITPPPVPEAKKKLVSFLCKSKPASSTRLFDTLLPGLSMTVPDLSSINCNTIKEKGTTEPVSNIKDKEETYSKVKNESGNDINVGMKQFFPVDLSNTVISLKPQANRRKALTSTPTNISPSQQPPFSFGVSSISPAEDSDELMLGRKTSHYCDSDEIFHSFEFEEVDIPEIENQREESDNRDINQRKGFENKEQQQTKFKIPTSWKPGLIQNEGVGDKQRISIEKKTKHIKSLMDSFLANKKLSINPDINTGTLKRKYSRVKESLKKIKSLDETKEESSIPRCNESSSKIPSQCDIDPSKVTKSMNKKLKKLNGIKEVSSEKKSNEKVERKQSRKSVSQQMKKKSKVNKVNIPDDDLPESFLENDSPTVIQNFDIPCKLINSTFPRVSKKKNEMSEQCKSYSSRKMSDGLCKKSSTHASNFCLDNTDNVFSNKKSHSASIFSEKENAVKERSPPAIDNSNSPSSFIYAGASLETICNHSVHVEPCSHKHTEIEAKFLNKANPENKTNSQLRDEFQADDNILEGHASQPKLKIITSPDKTSESQANTIQNTTDDHQLSPKKKKDSIIENVGNIIKDTEVSRSSLNADDILNSKNQCSIRVEVKSSRKKDTSRSMKRSMISVERRKIKKKQTKSTKRQSAARMRIKNKTANKTFKEGAKQWRRSKVGKGRKRISNILTCSLLSLREHFPERMIHQSEEHYVKTGKVFQRRIKAAPPDPLCQVISPPKGVCKESCGKRRLYYYYKINN